MFIIKLFFAISALFVFLVFGLLFTLVIKAVANIKSAYQRQENHSYQTRYPEDGKTIQGEYKILDETHKD